MGLTTQVEVQSSRRGVVDAQPCSQDSSEEFLGAVGESSRAVPVAENAGLPECKSRVVHPNSLRWLLPRRKTDCVSEH